MALKKKVIIHVSYIQPLRYNPVPGSRSRSKTAQDLSGLSGFPARFERFERFERFGRFFGKTAQTAQILLKKPLKNRSFLAVIFERFFKPGFSGPHGLTDKGSDFESEDSGFESLCGRLFIIKSCAVFLDKPLKTVQILCGFWAVFLDKPFKNRSNRSFWSKILSVIV